MSVSGPLGSVAASGHAAVSAVAAEVLRAGGNAFDAAVAGGFASAVAEPALTSLGGGGFLLAVPAQGRARLFDFFVDTPGLGRARIPDEPHFVPVTVPFPGSDQVFHVGLGSIAVPGMLKGLLHVHGRLGRLPLHDVLAPPAALAHEGVVLNAQQAYFLRLLHPIFTLRPDGRARFGRNGEPLGAGEVLRRAELGDFITSLAADGGRDFYEGALARRIESDLGEEGLLTARDLAAYRVIEREPLGVAYRGLRVLTNPGPAFGGRLFALSLVRLGREPMPAGGAEGAAWLVQLARLQIAVEGLRAAGVLGPEDLGDPGARPAPPRTRSFSRGTTHICVSDGEGNVASMTSSNGEGSGYFVPGTGVMLNNMLGEDDLHPEGFHADPPGERVASMMSPSVVLDGEGPRLALGSGGSKRIRSALLQVLTRVLDFARPLEESVLAPRIHWDGERIQAEPGLPEASLEALRAQWPLNVWDRTDVYFGGVHALIPGEAGAADPRRGGAVEIVRR